MIRLQSAKLKKHKSYKMDDDFGIFFCQDNNIILIFNYKDK